MHIYQRQIRKRIEEKLFLYFLDIGLRNSLASDVIPPEKRIDNGKIFENFFIIERLKFMHNNGYYPSHYFWRTYDKNEVDLCVSQRLMKCSAVKYFGDC